jgi:hypothetical protein
MYNLNSKKLYNLYNRLFQINKLILQISIIINLSNIINAHSWISCTNYEINNVYNHNYINDSIIYDINKCQGFSRNYNLQFNSDKNRGFGYDTGYNFLGTECNYKYDSSYYNNEIKMAQYIPGQQVCLTYPSKNHVSSHCTNNYISDNGIKIERSSNKLIDSFDRLYSHLNGIHQMNTIDYKGYQNCPGFCNNLDKTVCYVCFNLENNIDSGIYSFKWTWEFNKNEFYSTCWDAEIKYNNNNNIMRNLSTDLYRYNKDNICNSISNLPSSEIPSNEIPSSNLPSSEIPSNQLINNENTSNDKKHMKCQNKEDYNHKNNNQNEEDNYKNKDNLEFANIWEQCGGNNIKEKECKNSKCIKYSPYYSQCLPDVLEKNALCGQNDNKEINWKYDVCDKGSKCILMPGSMDYRCV